MCQKWYKSSFVVLPCRIFPFHSALPGGWMEWIAGMGWITETHSFTSRGAIPGYQRNIVTFAIMPLRPCHSCRSSSRLSFLFFCESATTRGYGTWHGRIPAALFSNPHPPTNSGVVQPLAVIDLLETRRVVVQWTFDCRATSAEKHPGANFSL